ncbi:dTMP kinase [Spirillospora sp. CA-294931]|uniref:dTMP kinase n=1 Tax=Spirillospora sp. CA-294931 TaxID=3240042 RepID=UPI003D8BE01D
MTGARRVALLGIDGSGKSTLARLLAERAGTGGRAVVLSSLRAHEHPDGPLRELSRHLDTLSKEADRLGSPDLKLAVLYLQMCTYGVAERFFTRELAARVVISERHPVLDALAYVPLYRDGIERVGGPGRREVLREQLAGLPPAAVAAARDWCAVLGARRDGRAVRLETLGAELVGLLGLPDARRAAELSARFGVAAPDVAVVLDLDVETALGRVKARGRHLEPHERAELLSRVGDGYDRALAVFDTVRVHRVAADRPPSDLAARVARLIAL